MQQWNFLPREAFFADKAGAMNRTLIIFSIAIAAGCAQTKPAQTDSGWTAEQQAAYDKCLQDNMAVAMAWEMIEQSCREEVDGAGGPAGLMPEGG